MLQRTLVPVMLIASLSMAAFTSNRPSASATIATAGDVPDVAMWGRLARLLPRMSPSRLYRP